MKGAHVWPLLIGRPRSSSQRRNHVDQKCARVIRSPCRRVGAAGFSPALAPSTPAQRRLSTLVASPRRQLRALLLLPCRSLFALDREACPRSETRPRNGSVQRATVKLALGALEHSPSRPRSSPLAHSAGEDTPGAAMGSAFTSPLQTLSRPNALREAGTLARFALTWCSSAVGVTSLRVTPLHSTPRGVK